MKATMDNLPDDVLREVFLWTLPNTEEMRKNSSTRSAGLLVPLRISHVCRRWREISLITRSLWSYLSFACPYSYGVKERRNRLDLYHTWLQRTNNSPLNFYVSLDVVLPDDCEGLNVSQRIVSSLLSNQRRWMDIDFSWYFIFSPELSGLEMSDMPKLVSAKVELRFISFVERMEPHLSIARSPLLENLDLHGVYSLDCGERPIYTLRRVRLVNERWTNVEARNVCLKLLNVAPNLKELSVTFFSGEGSEPEDSSSSDALVHGIESLTIETPFAEYLLPKLMLPSLRHLDYAMYRDSTILEFVQRSSPPLETLTVINGYPGNDLVPLLRSLPTLQTLIIQSAQDVTWLLHELTFGVDGRETCPELHYLGISASFGGQNDDKETLDALFTMLVSRFGDCAKISIAGCPEVDVPRQRTPEFENWLYHRLDHINLTTGRVVVCKRTESLGLLLK